MPEVLSGKIEEFARFEPPREATPRGGGSADTAKGMAGVSGSGKSSSSSDHYNPSVRLLAIEKSASGACGFHLTRSKWDPYPWVSAVDNGTPAEQSGLKAGDCVLEVNGEDILGLRITEVAKLVKAGAEHVVLLLWSSGLDPRCDPESLCCGPMPLSLQRLSVIMQNILSIIECPVCLDTIPPPAMQCQNGHLLCVNCRIRAEKCPVCRDRYTPRRALIAEQIYTAITDAFDLCRDEDRLRQRLFGPNATQPAPTATMLAPKEGPQRRRFLARLLGKACSMDNLATSGSNHTTTPSTASLVTSTSSSSSSSRAAAEGPAAKKTTTMAMKTQSTANQLRASDNDDTMTTTKSAAGNHSTVEGFTTITTTISTTPSTVVRCKRSLASSSSTARPTTTKTPTTTTAIADAVPAIAMFKHFSLSTNDLSLIPAPLASPPRCPSALSLSRYPQAPEAPSIVVGDHVSADVGTDAKGNDNGNELLEKSLVEPHRIEGGGRGEWSPTTPGRSRRRRPCSSLNASVECLQKGLRGSVSEQPMSRPASVSTSSGVSSASSMDSRSSLLRNELSSASTSSPSSTSSSPSSSSTSSSATSSPTAMSLCLPALEPDDSAAPVAAHRLSARGPREDPRSASEKSESLERKSVVNRWRCPCDCGRTFSASSKLQRHVKVVHRMPILSYGSSRAQLALPLHRPLDNAVLLLQVDDDDDNDTKDAGSHEGATATEDAADEGSKSDDKRHTKECWIRLKTTNDGGCILASALLPGSEDESREFVLETRVSCNRRGSENCSEDGVEGTFESQHQPQKQQEEQQQQESQQQPQQQKRQLRTRSIVHSMEMTTWEETYANHNNNNNNDNNNATHNNNNNNNKFNHYDKDLLSPALAALDDACGNGVDPTGNEGGGRRRRRRCSDLSPIGVICHERLLLGGKHGAQDGGELVLNIDVRRRSPSDP